VGLAARGSRQLGENIEKIEDPDELAQVRRQARKVRLEAIVTGLALTLVVLFIP
jgi:hypothetical protein